MAAQKRVKRNLKFFAFASSAMVRKVIPFSFTGHYLDSSVFGISLQVDDHTIIWIECKITGVWKKFTVDEFNQFSSFMLSKIENYLMLTRGETL